MTELHGISLLHSTELYGSAVFVKRICSFIMAAKNRTNAVLSKKMKKTGNRKQETLNVDNMCGSERFEMNSSMYILILPAKLVSFCPLSISHQRLAIAT